jgi:hypothetical protein
VDYDAIAREVRATPGQWFRLEVVPALGNNAAYARGKQFMKRRLTVAYRAPQQNPPSALTGSFGAETDEAHKWRLDHKDVWLCYQPPTPTEETP